MRTIVYRKRVPEHRLVDVHNYCVMNDLDLEVDNGDAWIHYATIIKED